MGYLTNNTELQARIDELEADLAAANRELGHWQDDYARLSVLVSEAYMAIDELADRLRESRRYDRR